MKMVFKYIGFIVVGVLILLFVAGYFLSPEFNVEQSIVIQASPDAIHPYVNDLKQWQKWTSWQELEPDIVTRYGNLTQGVGASQSWQGKGGSGHLHITASSADNGIAYDVFFGDDTTPSISAIEYKKLDNNATRVIWRIHGDVEMPVLGGFYALMVNSMIGNLFHKGLVKLKAVVEQKK